MLYPCSSSSITSSLIDCAMSVDPLYQIECLTAPTYSRYLTPSGRAPIAKRFGKSRIVEDPDLPRRKKSRHSLRVTGSRQRAGDDDPVIAGEHPGEALAVTLRQRLPQPPLLLPASPASILACLVPASPA